MSKKHILTPNRLIYKTILGLCMLEFWFSGLFSRKSNGLNRDFMNLFYLKETEELLNVKRHFRNFWVLVIIMTITFLAIGFSNGSLYYLGKKMNDPYVNFVNVVVPSGREGEAEMIIDSINLNNSMKGTYNISNATGFSFYYMDFMDTLNDKKRVFAGRTIDLSDPLLHQILDESSNLVSGKRAFNG